MPRPRLKEDVYELPRQTMQKAYAQIKGGRSRKEIGRAIWASFQRAFNENPELREKTPYGELRETEALITLDIRLKICDPACDEHKDYATEMHRRRGRERGQINKKRRKTDPEFAERERQSRLRSQRKRRSDPERWEEEKAQNRERYHRCMREDDYAFIYKRKRSLQYQQKRQDPEFIEKERTKSKRGYEQLKERLASDPEFKEEYYRERAAKKRERMERMSPEEREAWRAHQNALSRERYHRKKESAQNSSVK